VYNKNEDYGGDRPTSELRSLSWSSGQPHTVFQKRLLMLI